MLQRLGLVFMAFTVQYQASEFLNKRRVHLHGYIILLAERTLLVSYVPARPPISLNVRITAAPKVLDVEREI